MTSHVYPVITKEILNSMAYEFGFTYEQIHKYKTHFNANRNNVVLLKIRWNLTFRQWLEWWINTGHFHERGSDFGQYVLTLCRRNRGPYEIGNIKCVTSSEQTRELHLGKKLSPETKEKVRQARFGKKQTTETKEKIRQSNLGKKHTPETKEKISLIHLGKKLSPETKEKIRQARLGIKHTPEAKEKMRQARLGKPHPCIQIKKTCPHCLLIGKGPNMTRYHFDNCKLRGAA